MKTLLAVVAALSISGCISDADVASNNLGKASEQFEVARRVTLYNVIQDVGMISVEGYCSVEFRSSYSEVTCKDEKGEFFKHMMQDSDNTTMLIEQLTSNNVSAYQYRVLIKPSIVIPDFDIVVPGMENNSRLGS